MKLVVVLTIHQEKITHRTVSPLESYVHIHLLRLRVVLQKPCQIRICIDAVLRFKANQIDGRSLTVAHHHIDVIPVCIEQQQRQFTLAQALHPVR